MEVCILPISGGQFTAQVASCCMLADVGYKPNLIFASSGGSVCAFVMMATDWTTTKVPLLMEQLTSHLFAEEWTFPVMHNLYSLLQGSIFNNGNGGEELFIDLFDSKKLQTIETWVGAYNKDIRKFKILSNRGKEDCIMDLNWSDKLLHNLTPLSYASGDIRRMAQFIAASCSIPGIVPHKTIDDEHYIDGGVVCASPLSYFKYSLCRYGKSNNVNFHFTCSTCEDLNSSESDLHKRCNDNAGNHLVQGLIDVVSNMLNVSLVRDRVACNDILNSLGCRLLGTVTFKAHCDSLKLLVEFKLKSKNSGTILEIYSTTTSMLMDMAHFDGSTCLKYMEEAENSMMCRLWVYYNTHIKRDKSRIMRDTNLQSLKRLSTEHQLPDVTSESESESDAEY